MDTRAKVQDAEMNSFRDRMAAQMTAVKTTAQQTLEAALLKVEKRLGQQRLKEKAVTDRLETSMHVADEMAARLSEAREDTREARNLRDANKCLLDRNNATVGELRTATQQATAAKDALQRSEKRAAQMPGLAPRFLEHDAELFRHKMAKPARQKFRYQTSLYPLTLAKLSESEARNKEKTFIRWYGPTCQTNPYTIPCLCEWSDQNPCDSTDEYCEFGPARTFSFVRTPHDL
jgi:hypothetical protein